MPSRTLSAYRIDATLINLPFFVSFSDEVSVSHLFEGKSSYYYHASTQNESCVMYLMAQG